MSKNQRTVLCFGEFLLDQADRRLFRRERPVDLQGKPLELLTVLLRNAPGLVTRQLLRTTLWPDRVIEYDAAINAAVRDIRHVLGDDPKNPRYIETVPRHGYRFLMPVTSRTGRKRVARSRLAGGVLAALILTTVAFWALSTSSEIGRTELSTTARHAFVKGEWLLATHEPRDAGRAVSLFSQAVSAQPGYAEAWAGLADAHYFRFERPDVTMPAAEAAVKNALALDSSLGRAYRRLADIRFVWHWQFAHADTTYRRSLELDAGAADTHHAYAAFLMARERSDEAFAHMGRALAIDPLSLVLHGDLAWFYAMAGRHEQALRECAMLLDLATGNRRAIACPLRSFLALGRLEEAAEIASQLMPADLSHADTSATEQLTQYWRWRHQRSRAAIADGRYVDPMEMALIAARRGDPAAAIDWIERARRERSRLFVYVHLFPEFRALHEHPRFIDAALPVVAASSTVSARTSGASPHR